MKILYQAHDKTIFENEQECIEHEEESKKKPIFESTFRDRHGNKVPLFDEDGQPSDIWYLAIANREEAKNLQEVFQKSGDPSLPATIFAQKFPCNLYYDENAWVWSYFSEIEEKYWYLKNIFEKEN